MKFSIMDQTGHSTIEFTEDQKNEAALKFSELIGQGFTPAQRNGGSGDYTVNREFQAADETLFQPQLRGG